LRKTWELSRPALRRTKAARVGRGSLKVNSERSWVAESLPRGCGRGRAKRFSTSLTEVSSPSPSFHLEIAIPDDVTYPELTVIFAIRIGIRSIVNIMFLEHPMTSLIM
jgi:hypothetical protein